jgi:hypothetical protein
MLVPAEWTAIISGWAGAPATEPSGLFDINAPTITQAESKQGAKDFVFMENYSLTSFKV